MHVKGKTIFIMCVIHVLICEHVVQL